MGVNVEQVVDMLGPSSSHGGHAHEAPPAAPQDAAPSNP
jgi:hypothetical protein